MAEPTPSTLHVDSGVPPQMLGDVLAALPHDVGVLDHTGVLVATNWRWRVASGDPMITGTVGTDLIRSLDRPDDDRGPTATHLHDGLSRLLDGRGRQFEVQYEVRSPDGPRWFLVSAAAMPGGGVLISHTDTTDHHSLQDVLTELAFHDTLTGLPNRTLVTDRMRMALIRANRTQAFPAVMFIDLDGFKSVNDAYGHTVGDQVLIAASERLTRAVREGDTCGRWGGDEFVLIIDLNHPAAVDGLIQRARSAFEAPIEVQGHTIRVGLSIGVAVSRPNDHVDELIRRADEAMYAAKRTGSGVEVRGIIDSTDATVLHLP